MIEINPRCPCGTGGFFVQVLTWRRNLSETLACQSTTDRHPGLGGGLNARVERSGDLTVFGEACVLKGLYEVVWGAAGPWSRDRLIDYQPTG